MFKEVIPQRLYRDERPGYPSHLVHAGEVADRIQEWKDAGIRSILCLLDQRQLAYYELVPGGLLETYRRAGFEVHHLPVADHKHPPLNADETEEILAIAKQATPPLLIHCSAGIDRTGAAVRAIAGHVP